MYRLGLFFVFLSGLFLALSSPTTTAQDVIALPDPGIIDDILSRTNALRARRGLPPYVINTQLNAAAQDQANWLVATGQRGHYRPDGSRPSDRVRVTGYLPVGWCCGENYYMSIDATPDMVWNFWVNSPDHYTNLTNRNFTELGVGMATNGYRHSYVMVFAHSDYNNIPLTAAQAPVIAQSSVISAPPPPASPPAQPATEGGVYIVQRGDTLGRIASRHDTTVADLTRLNNIANPDLIFVGARLMLPGHANTSVNAPVTVAQAQPAPPITDAPPIAEAPPQSTKTYTVQRGDNLYTIGLNNGVALAEILALNDIPNPSRIYPGQVIFLPAS